QAIMLGADTVQLSSAIFWKGLKIIRECNDQLSNLLAKEGLTLDELKGISHKYIVRSDHDLMHQRPIRVMMVNPDKCICDTCSCVERGCYAIQRLDGRPAEIDQNVCNGCRWCKTLCVNNARQIHNP